MQTNKSNIILFFKKHKVKIISGILLLIGLILLIWWLSLCREGLGCMKVKGSLEVDTKGIGNDPEAKKAWSDFTSSGSNKETYEPSDTKSSYAKLYPYLRFKVTYTNPNAKSLPPLEGWEFDITNYMEGEIANQDSYDKLYKFSRYSIVKTGTADANEENNTTEGQIGKQLMLPEGTVLGEVSVAVAESKMETITDIESYATLSTPSTAFKGGTANKFSFRSGIPDDYNIFEESNQGICVYYKYKEYKSDEYQLFGATSIKIPTEKMKYIDISSGDIAEIELETTFADSAAGGFKVESTKSAIFDTKGRTKIIFADMNHKGTALKDLILVEKSTDSTALTAKPINDVGLTNSKADFYVEYLPIEDIEFVKKSENQGKSLSQLGFKFTKTEDDVVGGSVLLLRHADTADSVAAGSEGGYVGYDLSLDGNSGKLKGDMMLVNDKDKAMMFVFAKAKPLVDEIYALSTSEKIKARGKYLLIPEPILYDGTDADLQGFEKADFDTRSTRFFFTIKGSDRVSTREGLFDIKDLQVPSDDPGDRVGSKYIAFTFTQPLNTGIVPTGVGEKRENVFLRFKSNGVNKLPFGIAKKNSTSNDTDVVIYRSDATGAGEAELGLTTQERLFTVSQNPDPDKEGLPLYSFKSNISSSKPYLNVDTTNKRIIFGSSEQFFYLTTSIYDDNLVETEVPAEPGDSPGFIMCVYNENDVLSKDVACLYHGTNNEKREGNDRWPITKTTFTTDDTGLRLCPYLEPNTSWKTNQARWSATNFILIISEKEYAPQHIVSDDFFAYTKNTDKSVKYASDVARNVVSKSNITSWTSNKSKLLSQTIESCKKICDGDDGCGGFAFKKGPKECYFARVGDSMGTANDAYDYYKKN